MDITTFRCGHPRTPENSKVSPSTGARCRTCRREYLAAKRRGETPIQPEERAWNAMVCKGSTLLAAAINRHLEKQGLVNPKSKKA